MSALSEALVFIRHHQDGEVAEKIRNSGLKYNMNYGVSSLLLANYAKSVGRNQSLANLLWQENFREAKLLAFMVADYEEATEVTIQMYLDGCENKEMVEIAVTYFFSKLPNALAYGRQWIQSENRFAKMAGYLTFARLAMQNRFGEENDVQDLFASIEKDIEMVDDMLVFQSLSKAVQEIAFRRKDLKQSVIEKTKYLCSQNKSSESEFKLNELIQILEYC